MRSPEFAFCFRQRGRLGRINKSLGLYSTAVVFFTSDESDTGKGYEMTIE